MGIKSFSEYDIGYSLKYCRFQVFLLFFAFERGTQLCWKWLIRAVALMATISNMIGSTWSISMPQACVCPGLYTMYTRDNGPCSGIRLCNLWSSIDTKLLKKHRSSLILLSLERSVQPTLHFCQVGMVVNWTRKERTYLLTLQQCLLPEFVNLKRESIIFAKFISELSTLRLRSFTWGTGCSRSATSVKTFFWRSPVQVLLGPAEFCVFPHLSLCT
jgi:hypothetical protein